MPWLRASVMQGLPHVLTHGSARNVLPRPCCYRHVPALSAALEGCMSSGTIGKPQREKSLHHSGKKRDTATYRRNEIGHLSVA